MLVFMWKVEGNITPDITQQFGQILEENLRLCALDSPPKPSFNQVRVLGSSFGSPAPDLLLDKVISMGEW